MKTKKVLAKVYIWFLLVVLYAPIVFIVVFSFTEAKSLGNWTGFSTQLYQNLFNGSMQNSSGLLAAVKNTLLIALAASIVATVLGTIAAIGIYHLNGRKRGVMTFLNNIPMINPDIITGVSLVASNIAAVKNFFIEKQTSFHCNFRTFALYCIKFFFASLNGGFYNESYCGGGTPARNDFGLHPRVYDESR